MNDYRPYLHDLSITVAAPWVVLAGSGGQIRPGGVQGVVARDRRVLSRLEVRVDGREPVPIAAAEPGAGHAEYVGLLDWLGSGKRRATEVVLRRVRRVGSDGITEEITVTSRAQQPVGCDVEVALATDLAGTTAVRTGTAVPATEASYDAGRLTWSGVEAVLEPVPDEWRDGVARWRCELPPGGEWSVLITVSAPPDETDGFWIRAPRERADFSEQVRVDCDDIRVGRWLTRSLQDVAGLLLADPDAPDDRYLGAGPPWYLTLFGRDSLIASSMLLAVDPALVAGTLRALARRQGVKEDTATAEQPGKIPHELRPTATDLGGGLVLPPVYYGTHDATALWLTTLHRAWRWGMPADEVAALIPAAEAALGWLRDYADSDGDGFAEYIDTSGHGLVNQGWKDSQDAVQWPDGALAEPPIALCEVQGYAYAAALAGADLLDAHGGDGAQWRDWAARLKARFRDAFWIDDADDADGGYPAIALGGDKRPVAGTASNMGHLLATGILDDADAALVAERLAAPDLDSGFGLRTMSTGAQGFNPLGYHTGSVWPHDTAMAVEGLAATGHGSGAAAYTRGLVDAAEAFGYRLPELYGGAGRTVEVVPSAYPLACRPQAWAAAAPVAILTALLGLVVDVPAGTLRIAPVPEFPWRRFELAGLPVAGGTLSVRVRDGVAEVIEAPAGLKVET